MFSKGILKTELEETDGEGWWWGLEGDAIVNLSICRKQFSLTLKYIYMEIAFGKVSTHIAENEHGDGNMW